MFQRFKDDDDFIIMSQLDTPHDITDLPPTNISPSSIQIFGLEWFDAENSSVNSDETEEKKDD